MAIDIVHVDKDGLGLFSEVAEDVFDEEIDLDRLAKYLREKSHIMVIALHENVIVGQVLAVIHLHPDKGTELYLDDLGVSPSFQRQGIATSMLRVLFSVAKQRGCAEFWVATEPDNTQGNEFYKSLNLRMKTAFVFEGEFGNLSDSET